MPAQRDRVARPRIFTLNRCILHIEKYVQEFQRSQRVEDAGRQLCQAILRETPEKKLAMNESDLLLGVPKAFNNREQAWISTLYLLSRFKNKEEPPTERRL